jgi:uncharacterized MAPEG superfamily protein
MEPTMNIPVMVLLGFAAWTLLTLCMGVGIYRWSHILAGRASIAEWRADVPQGNDWYRRATRAHMNCVENLPLYTAIVVALTVTGLHTTTIDRLAVVMLVARICQTTIHIAFAATNLVISLRFSFYLVQAGCMIAIGASIVAALHL